MWQMLRNFIKNDPVIFVLAIIVFVAGGIFVNVEAFHLTSTSKFCGTCHPEEGVGPLSEYHTWANNIHATAKVECLDCHGDPGFTGYIKAKIGGIRDLYGEFFKSYEHKIEILHKGATDKEYAAGLMPNERCLFCHSDATNAETRRSKLMTVGIDFRNVDNVKNPEFRESFGRPDIMTEDVRVGVIPNHKIHIEKVGLNCVDCHLGVAHGGDFHNLPKMETCFECHSEMRAENKIISAPQEDDCTVCHSMQKGLQEGDFVKSIEGDRWYMADLSCTECHESAFIKPNTDKCATCHDDSYAEIMIETQAAYLVNFEEIQKIYNELFAQKLEMKPGKRALFNKFQDIVKILEKDGSRGIHNPEYFDMIFEKAAELAKNIEEYVEEDKKDHVVTVKKVSTEAHAEPEKEKSFEGNPAELIEMAPDTINIAENHDMKLTKSAVIFDHKKHYEMLACNECHANPEEGSLKIEITKLKGTSNTFHKELCFPCHKEKKVKKGTSCKTCHK